MPSEKRRAWIKEYWQRPEAKEKRRLWKLKNREKLLSYYKEWHQKHQDKCKGYRRKHQLKARGLTQEAYNALLEKQRNSCVLCNEAFRDAPHIDHCHTTNKVRGLLCRPCNVFLGYLERRKNLWDKTFEYLKR